MAIQVSTPSGLYADAPSQAVYIRESWADQWQLCPFLDCLDFSSVAAPDMSSATLRYIYGIGMPPGQTTEATYSRKNLIGNYVKVAVDGMPNWYGTLIELADDRHRSLDNSGTPVQKGHEHYVAYGLEILLDREPLRKSVTENQVGGEQTVGRGIIFNEGQGNEGTKRAAPLIGNRSTTLGEKQTYLFTWKLTTTGSATSAVWTAKQIIDYLLAYFSPRPDDDDPVIPFRLDPTATGLDWDAPTLDQEGRTVLDLLNLLMDRRRGLSWRVDVVVVDDVETVQVTPFTWAVSSISLPSGATLPANPNQIALNFDNAVNVEQSVVRTSAITVYDRVIAQGNRRGSLLTLAPADNNLVADWTTAQQTEYDNGASLQSGYGALDVADQRARNADFRAVDLLERVYSWFSLPHNWNGLVADGEGGTGVVAFPKLDESGNPLAESVPFWRPGLRIENYTPLETTTQYDGTKIVTGVTVAQPDAANNELRPPMVWIKVNQSLVTTAHVPVEKIAIGYNASSYRGQTWSCSVRVRDNECGIVLEVVGGKQHYLDSTFTGVDADDDDTAQFLDYTDLIATVYVRQDDYVTETHPPVSQTPDNDVLRVLIVPVDDAYLDYAPVGTVVDVYDGTLQKVTQAGFIRDDRDRLKDVARAAFEWYGTARRTLDLSYKGIFDVFAVGQLVTQISTGETINTVVTYLRFNLANGRTELATQFADLDVVL